MKCAIFKEGSSQGGAVLATLRGLSLPPFLYCGTQCG